MLMPDTNYGNLSAAVITSAGATSSTSIEVASADGAILPAAPFFATIMATGSLANANNSEIVKVTAKSTSGGITTLTVTRAQRGTSAVSWAAGEAILANAIYTEDVLSQSQGYYEAILSSGALFTITNASAPTTPVIGSRIRLTFDTTIPTAETVTLAINGGTAYEVDCHGATFATVGSVTNKVIIATNKVYTLEFDGTRWLMSNIASTILTNDIANNAVTTAKIANGAVTSSKIDWTTIGSRVSSSSSAITSSGTNWTNAGPSITVSTSGKYLFIGSCPVSANATSNQHASCRIYNSTSNAQIGTISDIYGVSIGVPTGVVTLSAFGIANVNANQTVRLQFRSPNQSGGIATTNENGSQTTLICIRIGSANA